MLFPGLGHLYTGKYIDGILFVVTTAVLMVILSYRSSYFMTFDNSRSLLAWGALVFVYLYSIIDAYRKTNKSMNKGLSVKVLLIVGIVLFGTVSLFLTRPFLEKELEYRKDQTHLTSSMKTKLPETPLSEVKLPVTSYYLPGSCMVGSGAGVAQYLEKDLDFDTFIAYGNPTRFMAGRTEMERYGTGFNYLRSFVNLGYTVYRGSPGLPLTPARKVFPDINLQNFITFRDRDEEFIFIKKLLSAQAPVIVGVRRGPLGLGSGGDFVSLVGYNHEGVWLNAQDKGGTLLEFPEVAYPKLIPYQTFFEAWGPKNYEVYWMEKTGNRKTEDEIFQSNKKNALEATANIAESIEYLKTRQDLSAFTSEFDTLTNAALSRYLVKKGYTELSNQYSATAKVYEDARTSLGPFAPPPSVELVTETLIKVKPLTEKAATMWP